MTKEYVETSRTTLSERVILTDEEVDKLGTDKAGKIWLKAYYKRTPKLVERITGQTFIDGEYVGNWVQYT